MSLPKEYSAPDSDGFNKDKALPLLYFDGMVFVEKRGTVHQDLQTLIEKHGPVKAQKYWNHFHMLPRVEDLETQRRWAFEMIDVFRQKAQEIASNSTLLAEIRDDDCDVEVTFWLHTSDSVPPP